MSHAEVNRTLSALDAHGFVTFETFSAILGTQALGAPTSSDVPFLRGVGHARPSWWSETPHALDSMW